MATNALDAVGLSLGTLNELKRGFEDFLQNLRRCIVARARDQFWGRRRQSARRKPRHFGHFASQELIIVWLEVRVLPGPPLKKFGFDFIRLFAPTVSLPFVVRQ